MRNKSQLLVYLTVAVGLAGLAGCASVGSYAQPQAQQYEDIDYENMNLLKSDRVDGKPEFYNGKVVFSANISKVVSGSRYHNYIFTANENGADQKRVTDGTLDIEPVWTKDGRIMYLSLVNYSPNLTMSQMLKFFIINSDGNNKSKIEPETYRKLYEEKIINK